ncbi:hypothetical protein FSARC_10673 [Fusarium sarcochroum]|uniref:Uncharacterized protein n=1 Tax=Fusarium sarcochroum TaxID=1208366 RepID=A0A8H4TKJ9_9HYPO|nr:hypothetical protein FSARC_10673 [Fusarium sarcochroum]
MDWTKLVTLKPLSEGTLRDIHASDQDIYPADLPFDRLQAWATAAPDLSIEFIADDSSDQTGPVSVGVVVAVPVKLDIWNDLLSGVVKETNLEASTDFGSPDLESSRVVGVHIFHIERHASYIGQQPVKAFGKFAVDSAVQTAKKQGFTVVGTSALTATDDGERTFKRLEFVPTGYEEVWTAGEAPRSGSREESMDDGSVFSRAIMMRRDE